MEVGMGHISVVTQIGIMNVYNNNKPQSSYEFFMQILYLIWFAFTGILLLRRELLRIVLAGTGPV
jgi:hypothetical protein